MCVASRASLYSGMRKANKEDHAPRARKDDPAPGAILPDFLEILTYVMDKSAIRLKSSYKIIMGSVELPFPVTVGQELCDYLRLCLWNSAGLAPSKELLTTPQDHAPTVARYLALLLAEGGGARRDLIFRWLDLAERLLSASAGMPQVTEIQTCF